MTTPDEAAHRTHITPGGDAIHLRQPEGTDDVFDVRLPVATTGEVRNEGDEPLTRDELDGMRAQLAEGAVPVFLDHGASGHGAGTRYGATEKIGEWVDPDIRTRDEDGEDELVATARLMDPTTLSSAVGPIRQALAVIREQVERGMSVSSSIAWRDDEAFPGGVDLMEVSIVGIGADPRTMSDADTPIAARAIATRQDLPEVPDALRFADATDARERGLAMGVDGGAVHGHDGDDGMTFMPGASHLSLRTALAMREDDAGEADADTSNDMTDDTDPDEGTDGEQDADGGDAERETHDAQEYREQMLAMQEQQTELLQALASDYDDKDDEDDDEQSADPESEQDAETGGESERDADDDESGVLDADARERVEDALDGYEDATEAIRSGDVDLNAAVTTPDPDDEQDADTDDGETTERQADSGPTFGFGSAE